MKLLSLLIYFLFAHTNPTPRTENKTIYDFRVQDILGIETSLAKYRGKVLLIVNVASKCSNTPQYEEIQALYEKYGEQGLVVLGFPSNNFLNQEPKGNEEILQFCTRKYAVTFPMFAKISVKGNNIHPLYQYLTNKKENGVLDAPIKWNFQKFLVDKEGKVVASFSPKTRVNENEVVRQVEKLLKK